MTRPGHPEETDDLFMRKPHALIHQEDGISVSKLMETSQIAKIGKIQGVQ
jgi:hypothetical protein